jgi:excisionase family DNA binding protein
VADKITCNSLPEQKDRVCERKLAYTIPNTAQLASISRSQVYVEIQTGRLPAIKIGGRTLILHDDLLGWLKSRPRKAFADPNSR